jgi:hypothetical protein
MQVRPLREFRKAAEALGSHEAWKRLAKSLPGQTNGALFRHLFA